MSTPKPDAPKPVVIIDSADTPDVFASFVHGYSRRQGNIHITLGADRWDHTKVEPRVVIIGRLVMPIEGVVGMIRGLQDFLRDMGIDINTPPVPQESNRTLQ